MVMGKFNTDIKPFDLSEFTNINSDDRTYTTISSYNINDNQNVIAIPLVVHVLSLLVLVVSVILIGYYIIKACMTFINMCQRSVKQMFHTVEIYEYSINLG